MSINVIMSQCIMLEEAYMKGLKQITGEAFFPIIAGLCIVLALSSEDFLRRHI